MLSVSVIATIAGFFAGRMSVITKPGTIRMFTFADQLDGSTTNLERREVFRQLNTIAKTVRINRCDEVYFANQENLPEILTLKYVEDDMSKLMEEAISYWRKLHEDGTSDISTTIKGCVDEFVGILEGYTFNDAVRAARVAALRVPTDDTFEIFRQDFVEGCRVVLTTLILNKL